MEAFCLNLSPRVLLAEDDTELRELLALVLENAGYQVVQCANGLQLLTQLDRSENFSVVISDLRMPRLSGLDVLDRLRNKSQRPPFICMTAFGDELTHTRASHLGAVATMNKPFDLDEMIALVERVCLRNEKPSRSRP